MGRWKDKYVIGLTGNIAMGKSLVRRMLEHLGAHTIDADGLAHQAMAPGAPAFKPVVITFGQWILDSEKRVDRAKLGAVAFSHPEALARLEAITHPIVGRAIDTLIQRARHEIIVVEAIKLIEGPLADQMDAIWVVDASEEKQIERLAKRGLSRPDAMKRIRVQNPQVDKLARAHVVISNNGTPEETWAQVQSAWLQLRGANAAAERMEDRQEIEVKPGESTPQPGQPALTRFEVMRGMPKNADQIAVLIRERTGRQMSRDDVLMAFGQKSYILAMANEQPLGLIGFLVENLVTRVDEFLILDGVPVAAVAKGLLEAVERASRELQSEVGYIFLPDSAPQEMSRTLTEQGYVAQELDDIKVPAWREAARESRPDRTRIFSKQLRAERVLKPL